MDENSRLHIMAVSTATYAATVDLVFYRLLLYIYTDFSLWQKNLVWNFERKPGTRYGRRPTLRSVHESHCKIGAKPSIWNYNLFLYTDFFLEEAKNLVTRLPINENSSLGQQSQTHAKENTLSLWPGRIIHRQITADVVMVRKRDSNVVFSSEKITNFSVKLREIVTGTTEVHLMVVRME